MFTSTRQFPRWAACLISCLIVLLFATACVTAQATPEPSPTLAPTETATATPEPTATLTPTPTETPTETPEPTATFTATPDRTATMAAQQTAAAATATQQAALAIEEIGKVLEVVSLTTEGGSIGWIQEKEIPFSLTTYAAYDYEAVSDGDVFDNYVMHVKIKWDSTSGLAGCGVILRGAQNLDTGEHYRFYTMRLSGAPLWDVELHDFGKWVSTLTGDIKSTSAISVEDGAVNEYIFVLEDATLQIYMNGKRVGNVTVTRLREGQNAFFAYQESGTTKCTFSDGWIWNLPDE